MALRSCIRIFVLFRNSLILLELQLPLPASCGFSHISSHGTRISFCALPASRKAAQVTSPPIRLNFLEPLDVPTDKLPQLSFYLKVFFYKLLNLIDFFRRKLVRALLGIHFRCMKYLPTPRESYAVEIGQSNLYALIVWNVNSENPHVFSE